MKLLPKESKLYAIVNVKCAVCHEGDLFVNRNPYALKDLFTMHKNCPVCGFPTEPETGFYYGAMYAAYGLSVGFSIANFLIYYLLFPFDAITFLIENTIILVALFPLTFRWSRAAWMNATFHYDKDREKMSHS